MLRFRQECITKTTNCKSNNAWVIMRLGKVKACMVFEAHKTGLLTSWAILLQDCEWKLWMSTQGKDDFTWDKRDKREGHSKGDYTKPCSPELMWWLMPTFCDDLQATSRTWAASFCKKVVLAECSCCKSPLICPSAISAWRLTMSTSKLCRTWSFCLPKKLSWICMHAFWAAALCPSALEHSVRYLYMELLNIDLIRLTLCAWHKKIQVHHNQRYQSLSSDSTIFKSILTITAFPKHFRIRRQRHNDDHVKSGTLWQAHFDIWQSSHLVRTVQVFQSIFCFVKENALKSSSSSLPICHWI